MVITILGGGVYAPRLCEALAGTAQAPDVELRLSARSLERLRVLAAHAGGRLPRHRSRRHSKAPRS
jgi:hypothetical protein